MNEENRFPFSAPVAAQQVETSHLRTGKSQSARLPELQAFEALHDGITEHVRYSTADPLPRPPVLRFKVRTAGDVRIP